MALNFPTSPTNGQIYYDATSGNRYIYDSSRSTWKYAANTNPMSLSSNTQVLYNYSGAIAGSNGLYFSSNTLFVANVAVGRSTLSAGYLMDVQGTINAANILLNGAPITATSGANVGNAVPVSPKNGMLWWNIDLGRLFIYYTDGDSDQWVEATTAGSATVDEAIVRQYADLAVANSTINIAFNTANAAYTTSNAAFGKVNAAYTSSNAAYTTTNSAYTSSNAAYTTANSAYTAANTKASTGKSIAMAIVFGG